MLYKIFKAVKYDNYPSLLDLSDKTTKSLFSICVILSIVKFKVQVPVEGGRGGGYSKPNKFRRKLSRMNRNRKQEDDKDEGGGDVTGDKPSTSVASNFQPSTSTKQRNKGSTDRTFNELLSGGEVSDFKPFKNVINKTLIVRDRIQVFISTTFFFFNITIKD